MTKAKEEIEKKQIGACELKTYEVLGEPGLWNIKNRILKTPSGDKTDLKQTMHLYLTKDSAIPSYNGGVDSSKVKHHVKCVSHGTKTHGGPSRKTCIAKSKLSPEWCSKCKAKVEAWVATQELKAKLDDEAEPSA